MTVDWSPLTSELALWRAENRPLPIWWRDDDAIKETPELTTLLTLSESLNCPVHLAVIPEPATPELVTACRDAENAVPVVHGWTHQNHAPKGEKKAEFGHPRAAALDETSAALARMRDLFGQNLLEMFVPPWNRIDDSVVAGLGAQGYRILSTFTPRKAREVAGMVQINTHVDPIFWRGGGGLADPDLLIAEIVKLLKDRQSGETDAAEPLGFLTHHLVHDAAIWSFTERCLSVLLDGGATPFNLLTTKEIP